LKSGSVKGVMDWLKENKVHIFINNACQTIRASEYYGRQLLKLEGAIAKSIEHVDNKIVKWEEFVMNQFDDIKDVDIKDKSSWNQNMEDIDPGEILEATIINQTVPTLLINQVKKTMLFPRFIIQVTAKEGQFSTNKLSTHPHTNMCKAAMNMLIRTMAEEKVDGQYVYSIDPGFVSGVNPQYDHYPLSAEDGAARILFPVVEFFNGTPVNKDWVHIRNFEPEKW